LHHPRLPLPRGRRSDDQLPPAALDLVHAGLGADGPRADAGSLCARDRRGIPLLQLRRRLAAAALGTHTPHRAQHRPSSSSRTCFETPSASRADRSVEATVAPPPTASAPLLR